MTKINKAFGHLGNERGKRTEARIAQVINSRVKARKTPPWLVDFELAPPNTPKIDGWIHTSDIGKLFVQIKSSKRGERQALSELGQRKDISIIRIPPGLNDTDIYRRCIQAIGPKRQQYLRQRQEKNRY